MKTKNDFLIVSVVMSVYNGEDYLREAVESILGQTFTDFEFIIIDDGSTDSSWQILSGYNDPRIRLLQNDKNIGLTRSLNKGLSLARGKYIARQDADDVSLPERLAYQVAYLDSHESVGLIGTSYIKISETGRVLRTEYALSDNELIQQQLIKGNGFCHGSVMFRRTCMETVGFYRPHFKMSQDYDYWLRIAERYQVDNLTEPLYKLRYTMESVSIRHVQAQSAYRRIAQESALIRRQTDKDPFDKMSDADFEALLAQHTYKVFPDRLFFLVTSHYEMGDYVSAAYYLQKAQLLASKWQMADDFIKKWALAQAKEIFTQQNDFSRAKSFLTWVLSELRCDKRAVRQALSDLHMTIVFSSVANKEWATVRQHLWQGIYFAPHWAKNRGVWSIAVQSYLGIRRKPLPHSIKNSSLQNQ